MTKHEPIIIGSVWGWLTVTGASIKTNHKAKYPCVCKCGAEKLVAAQQLRNGSTVSCGCFAKQNNSRLRKTHGMSQTPAYNRWKRMLSRCEKTYDPSYEWYGGRGIKVCNEWKKFEQFYEDMGEPPTPKHSIDRIDVNGNYSKDNCRWATASEQARNMTTTVFVEIHGKKVDLTTACERAGLSYTCVYSRIYEMGWTVERALTSPIARRGSWATKEAREKRKLNQTKENQ